MDHYFLFTLLVPRDAATTVWLAVGWCQIRVWCGTRNGVIPNHIHEQSRFHLQLGQRACTHIARKMVRATTAESINHTSFALYCVREALALRRINKTASTALAIVWRRQFWFVLVCRRNARNNIFRLGWNAFRFSMLPNMLYGCEMDAKMWGAHRFAYMLRNAHTPGDGLCIIYAIWIFSPSYYTHRMGYFLRVHVARVRNPRLRCSVWCPTRFGADIIIWTLDRCGSGSVRSYTHCD